MSTDAANMKSFAPSEQAANARASFMSKLSPTFFATDHEQTVSVPAASAPTADSFAEIKKALLVANRQTNPDSDATRTANLTVAYASSLKQLQQDESLAKLFGDLCDESLDLKQYDIGQEWSRHLPAIAGTGALLAAHCESAKKEAAAYRDENAQLRARLRKVHSTSRQTIDQGDQNSALRKKLRKGVRELQKRKRRILQLRNEPHPPKNAETDYWNSEEDDDFVSMPQPTKLSRRADVPQAQAQNKHAVTEATKILREELGAEAETSEEEKFEPLIPLHSDTSPRYSPSSETPAEDTSSSSDDFYGTTLKDKRQPKLGHNKDGILKEAEGRVDCAGPTRAPVYGNAYPSASGVKHHVTPVGYHVPENGLEEQGDLKKSIRPVITAQRKHVPLSFDDLFSDEDYEQVSDRESIYDSSEDSTMSGSDEYAELQIENLMLRGNLETATRTFWSNNAEIETLSQQLRGAHWKMARYRKKMSFRMSEAEYIAEQAEDTAMTLEEVKEYLWEYERDRPDDTLTPSIGEKDRTETPNLTGPLPDKRVDLGEDLPDYESSNDEAAEPRLRPRPQSAGTKRTRVSKDLGGSKRQKLQKSLSPRYSPSMSLSQEDVTVLEVDGTTLVDECDDEYPSIERMDGYRTDEKVGPRTPGQESEQPVSPQGVEIYVDAVDRVDFAVGLDERATFMEDVRPVLQPLYHGTTNPTGAPETETVLGNNDPDSDQENCNPGPPEEQHISVVGVDDMTAPRKRTLSASSIKGSPELEHVLDVSDLRPAHNRWLSATPSPLPRRDRKHVQTRRLEPYTLPNAPLQIRRPQYKLDEPRFAGPTRRKLFETSRQVGGGAQAEVMVPSSDPAVSTQRNAQPATRRRLVARASPDTKIDRPSYSPLTQASSEPNQQGLVDRQEDIAMTNAAAVIEKEVVFDTPGYGAHASTSERLSRKGPMSVSTGEPLGSVDTPDRPQRRRREGTPPDVQPVRPSRKRMLSVSAGETLGSMDTPNRPLKRRRVPEPSFMSLNRRTATTTQNAVPGSYQGLRRVGGVTFPRIHGEMRSRLMTQSSLWNARHIARSNPVNGLSGQQDTTMEDPFNSREPKRVVPNRQILGLKLDGESTLHDGPFARSKLNASAPTSLYTGLIDDRFRNDTTPAVRDTARGREAIDCTLIRDDQGLPKLVEYPCDAEARELWSRRPDLDAKQAVEHVRSQPMSSHGLPALDVATHLATRKVYEVYEGLLAARAMAEYSPAVPRRYRKIGPFMDEISDDEEDRVPNPFYTGGVRVKEEEEEEEL